LNLFIISWAIIASPPQDILYHFQENRLVTFFSSFQLFGMALFCFLIFETSQLFRKKKSSNRIEEHSHYVWLLMALGFLYLSFDEVLMLHEKMDFSIHLIYQLQETNWTDRIDDLLVLVYVTTAIILLYLHKNQLSHYKQKLKSYLFPGFALLLVMIILDLLTNRNDLISSNFLFQILSILEEICKLAAEGIFLLMAYACWKQTLLWQISEYKKQP